MSKIGARGDSLEPAYLNNLKVGSQGWGVVSGLAITQRQAAQGGPNMSVDVANGTTIINNTSSTISATTNVTISTADGTTDRYDLIVVNQSGTMVAVTGTITAQGTTFADDRDFELNNEILIAEVLVPAGDTTIEDSQITDKRITIREATMTTGIYTGDNSATQAISGVGFKPTYLIIHRQLGSDGPIFKTDQDGTKSFASRGSTRDNIYADDMIISLDSDGFTVGDGTGAVDLTNPGVYTWIAFQGV